MKFEHAAHVAAAPDAVFALTQDYARRLTWDPFLSRAELVGGASRPAVGVRAWCVTRTGIGMETEYVTFTPPRLAAVKMTTRPVAARVVRRGLGVRARRGRHRW